MTPDYSFTKHRIIQWFGILLALGLVAVSYWYFQVYAGVKTNVSPTGALTSGLVGYWTFDGADTTSTTATDRSGSSNTGTLTGGPTVTTGKLGQALSFDGTDDYVSVSDATSLDLTTAITVSAWVYGRSWANSEANFILAKIDFSAGEHRSYQFQVETDGKLRFRFLEQASSDGSATAPAALDTNRWYYVTATYDRSNIKLYVDGALVNTTAETEALIPNNNQLSIGRAVRDNDTDFGEWDGSLDEVRVYNRALSAAEIQSLYALGTSDPVNASASQPQGTGRLDSSLAAYFPLDDGTSGATPTSASDSSTNAATGTLTGGPTWTTGQIGSAVDFDGTDDYITTPDADVLDVVDSMNFTLSGWFNRDTFTTDDTILAKSNGQAASDTGYNVYIDDSTDKVTFVANDATDQYKLESVSTFTATGWHHYSIVWDDSGSGQTKLYIDGAPEAATATGTFANVNSLANAVAFRLGAESDAGNPFDGKLDEARFYRRALSADEVTQLYRLTTPTSVDTSLKGYWSFNGKDVSGTTAYDRSGAGNTGTLTLGPTVTPGKLGQALNFDGSNDYVTVPSATSLNSTSQITVSAWIKRVGTGTRQFFVSKGSANTVATTQYWLELTSGNVLVFELASGSTEHKLTSGFTLTDTQNWHHVVGTYDGTTQKIFLDGVQDATTSTWSGALNALSDDVAIGNRSVFYDIPFNGSIDEVRIYNRALSAGEIQSLYKLGQSDEVNTGASQAQGTGRLDSGLAGYWKMDDGSGGNAADASTNGNTGILNGDTTWGTGQIAGAASFDGTGDYIDVGDMPSAEGKSQLTMSAWVKPNALGDYKPFFTKQQDLNNDMSLLSGATGDISQSAVIFVVRNASNSYGTTSAGQLVVGTWTHIVGVFDGTQTGNASRLKIYINGVQQTLTFTGTVPATTPSSSINMIMGSSFNGSIDEGRIYNRALSPDEVGQLYRLTSPTGTDTGLKGYWSFNGKDMTSTSAYDRSGAGNTGTLTLGPSVTPGKIGQALSFDGSDDYVALASSAPLVSQSAVTVSAWIKPTVLSEFGGIVSKYLGIGDDITFNLGGACCTNASSALAVSVRNGSDTYGYTSAGVISTGTWTFVTAVFDGSLSGNSNRLKIYTNGNQQTLSFNGTIPATTSSGGSTYIGRADTSYFNGAIDEVRIYTRALSVTEIKALYNASR